MYGEIMRVCCRMHPGHLDRPMLFKWPILALSAISLALVSLFSAPALLAQSFSLRFDHVTAEDGLSHNSVFAVLQDQNGFLWFGTEDGLNRYDGYGFSTFRHMASDSASLSGSWIWSLYEDRQGSLWVGTFGNGLNRFDRATETFQRFLPTPSGIGPTVQDFAEDDKGMLWIGSDQGLHVFNPESQALQASQEVASTLSVFEGQNVSSLLFDDVGQLWIGTMGAGLYRWNPKAEALTHFPSKSEEVPGQLRNGSITALHIDHKDELWVGTHIGVYRFNQDEERFLYQDHIRHPKSGNNQIEAFYADPTFPDAIWISVGAALVQMHTDRDKEQWFVHQEASALSLGRGTIEGLLIDHSGVLWAATRSGLSRADLATRAIQHFEYEPGQPHSLNDSHVRSLYETRDGTLWVGTNTGLNRFDAASETFQLLPSASKTVVESPVFSLAEDRNGRLWLGRDHGGLNVLKQGAISLPHRPRAANEPVVPILGIMAIHATVEDQLLVGAWNQGLWSIPFPLAQQETPDAFFKPTPSLTKQTILTIQDGPEQSIWVGTFRDGLHHLDKRLTRIASYGHEPDNPESLSSNTVFSVYQATDDALWVGTDQGLNHLRFTPDGTSVARYTTEDGLPNNTVYCIIPTQHHLWLSTNKGLSRFDMQTTTVRNFDVSDGLQGNEYTLNGCLKNRRGQLLFGGRNGFDRFHPDSLHDNNAPPYVVLTDFQLAGQSVEVGQKGQLAKPILRQVIGATEEIVLSFQENVFSFSFAGLHFTNSEKNQYAYQMEGLLDDTWIPWGTRRHVTFTGLQPGTYTFRVKASNADGIWNEAGTAVRVTILPPWWHTRWAYGAYGLFTLGFVWGFVRLRSHQLQRHNRNLARLVRQRTAEVEAQKADLEAQNEKIEAQAEKLMELDAAKSRFFANISHEFRTPLTLIRGPIESALQGMHGALHKPMQNSLEVMHRNTHRLQQLIDQLLDLSKLEAGKLTLRASPGDLIAFTRRLLSSFDSLAAQHTITLSLTSDTEYLALYFDADKLEKIITNLLSNAFKFTPEGGTIALTITDAPDSAEERGLGTFASLSVSDTGIGISAAALPHVFDRFYQVDDSLTRRQEGTGIGLALIQELVVLHGGEITVQSTELQGTTFTLRLPKGAAHLSEKEKADPVSPLPQAFNGTVPALPRYAAPNGIHLPTEATSSADQRPTVLIVEDNVDLRTYLHQHLAPYYSIVEAVDGEDGFAKAQSHTPTLIISDVMMPKLDGIGLLKRLKAHETLQSVPVILLTARAAEQDRLEGLHAQADDYIAKPFNADELKARVRNLIVSRDILRKQFSREVVAVSADTIDLNSTDTDFLIKAQAEVQANVGNSSFDVQALADALFVSKRNLYRRLNDLTNLSPAAFIRQIRLEHAHQLLEQRAVSTVSESAHAVGFSNVGYFSRLYRQMFSTSPSDTLTRN